MSDPEPLQNPTPTVTETQPIITPLPEPIGVPPEPVVSESANLEKPLEAPPVAPGAPPSPVAPLPADTLVTTPEAQNPAPVPEQASAPIEPLPPVIPITAVPQIHPRSFLTKALETIQFRKRAKLEKIIKLAMEKRSITNDQVEKLLRVSDATATRYLSQLVKDGRLRRVGHQAQPRYEPV